MLRRHRCRGDLVSQAIEAGKRVYREKPIADTLDKAVAVARSGGLSKLI